MQNTIKNIVDWNMDRNDAGKGRVLHPVNDM